MRIIVDVIPHNEQRYETCGDWFWEGETLYIKVSKMSDWRREFLIAWHELFECMWSKQNGVTQEAVDAFDMKFLADQKKGDHPDEEEPGDNPNCPCYIGHQLGVAFEQLACIELKEDWIKYNEEVDSLCRDEK